MGEIFQARTFYEVVSLNEGTKDISGFIKAYLHLLSEEDEEAILAWNQILLDHPEHREAAFFLDEYKRNKGKISLRKTAEAVKHYIPLPLLDLPERLPGIRIDKNIKRKQSADLRDSSTGEESSFPAKNSTQAFNPDLHADYFGKEFDHRYEEEEKRLKEAAYLETPDTLLKDLFETEKPEKRDKLKADKNKADKTFSPELPKKNLIKEKQKDESFADKNKKLEKESVSNDKTDILELQNKKTLEPLKNKNKKKEEVQSHSEKDSKKQNSESENKTQSSLHLGKNLLWSFLFISLLSFIFYFDKLGKFFDEHFSSVQTNIPAVPLSYNLSKAPDGKKIYYKYKSARELERDFRLVPYYLKKRKVNKARFLLNKIILSNAGFKIRNRANMFFSSIPRLKKNELDDPLSPQDILAYPNFYKGSQILWRGILSKKISSKHFMLLTSGGIIVDCSASKKVPNKQGDIIEIFGTYQLLKKNNVIKISVENVSNLE